jgi:hypothetical protein
MQLPNAPSATAVALSPDTILPTDVGVWRGTEAAASGARL